MYHHVFADAAHHAQITPRRTQSLRLSEGAAVEDAATKQAARRTILAALCFLRLSPLRIMLLLQGFLLLLLCKIFIGGRRLHGILLT